jgi:preprotein translocase SecE subunit
VGATPEAQAPPPSTSLGDGVAEQGDAQAERQLSRGGADGGGRDVAAAAGEVPRERPEGIQRGFSRVVAFLRASWAELQRVQWPDRRQVAQATAVVLGFVAIAGLYLGAADFVAKEIVDAIL